MIRFSIKMHEFRFKISAFLNQQAIEFPALLRYWQIMVFHDSGGPWSFKILADHGLLCWNTMAVKIKFWQRVCIVNVKTSGDQEKRYSGPRFGPA
jgi:hypothetical protein